MLQHLPQEADITLWQGISRGIGMNEADICTPEIPLVALDKRPHDINADIRARRFHQLAANPEISASDVDKV